MIPLKIFLRALGLYLLFTLPAIALPVMYVYSAFLAVAFGSAAGILFIAFYILVSGINTSYRIKIRLLFLFIPVVVALSYCLIGILNAADDLWGFNFFMVFPGIAVIAGWASLFISRKSIRQHLDPEVDELHLLLKP